MSYDLFFYKQKKNTITTAAIVDYLSNNLVPVSEHGNQWFFENEDTEVYFSFETNDPEDEHESFDEYENTGIAFNLNFIRPSFFGLEAFRFVEQFIDELDLFVLNPQVDHDVPYKPDKGSLFENWDDTNLWASKENASDSPYCPIDASNAIWEYNFNRQHVQLEIGEDYFVSRIFFFKKLEDGKAVTLSTWTEHIPNVLPDTDYYFLFRKYERMSEVVEDSVLLTSQSFKKYFGDYFEPYSIADCMIIHPDKAASVGHVFNSVKPDFEIKGYLERIGADSIVNVKFD